MVELKYKRVFPALILIGILFLTSCYYDNYEDLYRNIPNQCDTSAVSYAIDIEPWVNNTCVTCHNASIAVPVMDLSTYEGVKANAAKMLDRVSQPEGSALLMPQGGPKLDQCKIDKLSVWIQMGSPNN